VVCQDLGNITFKTPCSEFFTILTQNKWMKKKNDDMHGNEGGMIQKDLKMERFL
jgi:hypothetical protein